jgi:hypothetical protein
MSYNIDTWRTKEAVNLRIPLDALYGCSSEIEVELLPDAGIEVCGPAEGFEIKGVLLLNNDVEVSKIALYGERSGWAWDDFKALLAQSSGKLVASQVWEGGDSITRITVIDGVVTEENVEI